MGERIVKASDERKQEILDVSERMFVTKGYELTTVNDILNEVKIAKGTFYYYFKSKEEVLDALIERRVLLGVENAKRILASDLSPIQKILAIIMAQQSQGDTRDGLVEILHDKDNSKMHVKSFIQTILHLSPCLAEVVIEGNESGIFNTPYPLESIELLLASAMILFDDDFFIYPKEVKSIKVKAYLDNIERVLGAESGSFSEFERVF